MKKVNIQYKLLFFLNIFCREIKIWLQLLLCILYLHYNFCNMKLKGGFFVILTTVQIYLPVDR